MSIARHWGGGSSLAQETVIYNETFGSPSSKNISFNDYTGWKDRTITPVSTVWKVGNGSASSFDYSGASQDGNMWFNEAGDVFIHFGDKCKDYSSLKLSAGVFKGTGAKKDINIEIYYSTDGGTTWSGNILPTYKSDKGSTVRLFEYPFPSTCDKCQNFSLKFTSTSTTISRIDDISLKGTNPNVKTFKFSATTCTAMLGATNNEFPTLSNDYGTPVTYSSSNPAVASVLDKDGTLNLNGIGKTIITATLDTDHKVTASYELTVNQKTTDVVFDFTAKPNKWGITPTSDNNNSNTDDEDLYVEGVKLNTTSGKGSKTCIFSSSSSPTPNLRVYSGGSLTFTAPLGYNISKIVFTGTASFTTTVGTFSNMTWTDAINGSDKVVILKRSTAKTEIKTASVSLVKVTNAESISLPASNNGKTYYATFSCSRDVIFTNNVIVNAVKVEDGSLVITPLTTDNYQTLDDTNTELTGYYVPANTGVLISGNNNNNNAKVYYPAENQAVTIDNNQLKPAPINGGMIKAVDGNKYYKLAYSDFNNKTGLGFYWGADNGGAFKVKSGTAYLEVPVTLSPAKGFAFGGDETGITNIDANSSNSRVIYNLAGQRMSDTVKPGLYIINGKKTVVR